MSSERRHVGFEISSTWSVSALLSAAVDLVADGVLLVDLDGHIVFANRAIEELLGYAPGELIGKGIELLVPLAQQHDHRADLAMYAADPGLRKMGRPDLDIEARHLDGHHIPVDVQLTPLAGAGIVVASVRDMTAQRNAAAERAIDRLDLDVLRRREAQINAHHDVVLQRLYALGTHFQAEAARDTMSELGRFHHAANAIDELIDSTRTTVFGMPPMEL